MNYSKGSYSGYIRQPDFQGCLHYFEKISKQTTLSLNGYKREREKKGSCINQISI